MPSNEDRLNAIELKALLRAMDGATLEIQRNFFEWLGQVTKTNITARRAGERRIKEIRKIYDDMIAIWGEYADMQLPIRARDAQRIMLEALRKSKAQSVFWPKQEIEAIIADTKNKFIAAAQGGFDRIETLMRRDPSEIAAIMMRSLDRGKNSAWLMTTKQLNISERAVNETVERGLALAADPRVVRTQLTKEYMDNLIEGKVLVITRRGKDQYWDPAKYSELVARTRTREAQTVASISTLRELGQDLIRISSHSTDTEICQEFEGKIFSLSGTDPRFPRPSLLPPYHPNCLHSVLPHIETRTQAAAPDRLETRSEAIARGAISA